MSDMPVRLRDHFDTITKNLDMEKHRIALRLTSSDVYYVAAVLGEWDNAVYFQPEHREPMLVFKNCIEAIGIASRPQKRSKDED